MHGRTIEGHKRGFLVTAKCRIHRCKDNSREDIIEVFIRGEQKLIREGTVLERSYRSGAPETNSDNWNNIRIRKRIKKNGVKMKKVEVEEGGSRPGIREKTSRNPCRRIPS